MTLVAILAAILLAFYVFGIALERAWLHLGQFSGDPRLARAIQALLPRLAPVPFAILGLLMIGLQLLRLRVSRRRQAAPDAFGTLSNHSPVDTSRVLEDVK